MTISSEMSVIVQPRCAFVYVRTLCLVLEQLFCQLVFVGRLITTLYEIEPFLLLILVKQSVARFAEINLDCWIVLCDFSKSIIQSCLIMFNDSCNIFCQNFSDVNITTTEGVIEF